MRLSYQIIFAFISILYAPAIIAQVDVYSESEIGIQDKFIAANREKILGNYEKAIELYEEVYQKDRRNPAVCYELARTYHQIGETEKALAFSDKSINLDPNNEWYYIFNSELLEKAGKYEKAAKRFESLVKKDPENKFYYLRWAFNELESGNAEKAIFAFNELEKREGISEDVIHRKFNIYVNLGDNKRAIKELLVLCDSAPTNTRYLNNLAGFYMNIGKKKEAKKVYKKILEINPDDGTANIALAENSESVGRDASYLKAIYPVISNPDVDLDLKIKELIPFIDKVNSNPSNNVTIELINIAEQLNTIHPNNAKVHSIYGDILFNSGKLELAENEYLITIGLTKKVFSVWDQLMYTQAELGKYEELIATSSNAIDFYPNQASSYYYNALANLKIEKNTEAKDLATEALVISGKNYQLKSLIYQLLSEIEFLAGDYEKAHEHGIRAQKNTNNSSFQLLELMGDISFKRNLVEEAVDYWKKSQEAGNESERLQQKILQKQIIE